MLLLLNSYSIMAFQQDSVEHLSDIVLEEESQNTHVEYWRKNHYNGIPKVDKLTSSPSESFDEVVDKYKSSEFQYIESISDQLSVWSSIKKWINKFLSDLFPEVNAQPADWFYDIIGIAGGLLVIFLFYKFFFSGKQFIRNPKESDEAAVDNIDFVEKNLMDVDVNGYIKQAINSNNYSLAIRYQQLLNIQLLAKKNIISWDQHKTNLELMDEIANAELKSEFQKCNFLFDYVWFGDFSISEDKFQNISSQFIAFQRRWS